MTRWWTTRVPVALAVVALAACGDEGGPGDPVFDPVRTIGGDRPATLTLPDRYEGGSPIPLVMVLHGFTGNSGWTDRYFGISQRIDPDRIAVILPDGTRNDDDQPFWNATDYCCDLHGSGVDDVGYLNSLVSQAREHMEVDGVYLVGLSNGGFMSYRMACESMPGLRAIAPVAGTTFSDVERCAGARPVSVLHIHGTADNVIRYEGGGGRRGDARHPGAEESVHRWAARAGCDLESAETLPSLDLVEALPEGETDVTRYESGCSDGRRVELWTIKDGSHVPPFDADEFGARVVAWFLDGEG